MHSKITTIWEEKNNSKICLLVTLIIFAFLFSGCAVTKDPRKAGLFSNIVNESSGEYDRKQGELDKKVEGTTARKQELQQRKRKVDQNYSLLDARKKSLERQLALQQNLLSDLEDKFIRLQLIEGAKKSKLLAIQQEYDARKKECLNLWKILAKAQVVSKEDVAEFKMCTTDFISIRVSVDQKYEDELDKL